MGLINDHITLQTSWNSIISFFPVYLPKLPPVVIAFYLNHAILHHRNLLLGLASQNLLKCFYEV